MSAGLWRRMPLWPWVALLLSACGGRGGGDPEAVVERFLASTIAGNNHEVYNLLGPGSRKRLDELRQSAKRVSGRLALQQADFLSVGRAPPAWEPQGARLVRRSADEAEVQVFSSVGDRFSVTLVREGHAWKIELPGS